MLTINEVDVAGRLRPVLLKLARELRRDVADLGVSAGQATLLVSIKRQPGISAAELAAQERMSAAGMDVDFVPFRGAHEIPPIALQRFGLLAHRALGA